MRYNNLPETNLKVSLLSLGTMMFGGQTNENESLRIMDYAYEHGVNLFDTANVYNQGESERIVGKGIKNRREKILLATKVNGQMGQDPNDAGLSRRNILSAADKSLQRLDTDYIDIYYMHAPDYKTSLEESLETMSRLVASGKIRYIGVSNFAAWQIADILAICDKRSYVTPIITQNVCNLITRGIESELVPFLKAHRLGLTTYNPLAGGLLAGKHRPGNPAENTRFANNKMYYDRYWSNENFTAVEKLKAIAEKRRLNLLQLSMKWCATQEIVTSVISGVSRLSQLEQNIESLEGEPLDSEAMAQCDEIWCSLAGTRFAYNR
ncbi:MAG: aldo/keto reductase [Synergistaceae bacterium]|jgi:aryl-alcohol dehydrogenase-like predicted oxidoreductase|nr:aldo/keto reductase [Synergistaceae bacterium]